MRSPASILLECASTLLLTLVAGSAVAGEPALLKLSMEHFRDTAGVTTDRATSTTTVTTESGYVERSGPLGMVWNDEFLQGMIDGSGQRSYRVVVVVIYAGAPRAYATASFTMLDGPHSVPLTVVQRSEELCATGQCTYTDRLSFAVGGAALEQLARGAGAAPTLWHFTLHTHRGPAYDGVLSTAEIAGLIARVDAAAKTLNTQAPLLSPSPEPPAYSTAAPPALPLRDLGITGIAVAAAAEQPQRRGILIAEVKPGSVAQRAGLIVGDILYDYAGHPLSSLAELQQAMAATDGVKAVSLKVFRGTSSMELQASF
jgi:hypothetical protein